MRRAGRVDANQAEIVKTLRACGCKVRILSPLGDGIPDLLVGRLGRNYLLEVKDGSKPPSARELTPAEWEFHETWTGQACVVESVEEALRAVGLAAVRIAPSVPVA